MSNVILTNRGMYFEFLKPEKHSFPIFEIAHSLSNLCRFTGHVKTFYSVAQHSVLTSYLVPPELRMCALLHDAGEAYLGDVSSPLKALLPDYKAIEGKVEAAIAKVHGITYPHPPAVKFADLRMLLTEKRDLMFVSEAEYGSLHDQNNWPAGVTPINYKIRPMEPELARTYFLNRYYELKGA